MSEPMSDERLAAIGAALAVAGGPTIAHELHDEVQRLRALEDSYIIALDQANIGDMQRLSAELDRCAGLNRDLVNESADLTARAETAERELAELRERLGTESVEWGVRGGGGTFAVFDEAEARWHERHSTEPMTAMRRVVGEWKAAEQQPEDGGAK